MTTTEDTDLELNFLLETIHSKFQHDFRNYSRESLKRRLSQALIKFNLKSLSEIQNKLIHEPNFFPKLMEYLTVNTTEFFRDPDYFKTLRSEVIPLLKTYPSVKIWIAGCSTGEEAISFSILLKEAKIKRYLIYATDVNPSNIEKAKRGIFSLDAIKTGSRNYHQFGGEGTLSDYIETGFDSAKFDDSLLKNVLFSDHSLATDSVFSEVHFVSCRNVLIYFEKPLQERAFNLFNDSIIRGGHLGLGSKETIQFSSIRNQFQTIDANNRIYQKIISPKALYE